MGAFDGFLDNFVGGLLNPKGMVADFRHASKTFALNTFRLSPKVKFLYHVAFSFSPKALASMPTWENRHKAEVGLLVKAASLPGFSAAVETKKKYNRVKNIQTNLNYDPVTITFHDDNLGMSTGLLEAYYRYYFADGHYGTDGLRRAYNKLYSTAGGSSGAASIVEEQNGAASASTTSPGDSTYKNAEFNKFRFGLDAGSTDPFFTDIQISQMTRHTYTTYTLVNPIISDWKHGDVAYSENSTVENTMTVNYEAVWYERGAVEAGEDGNPKNFGTNNHYDTIPSPNTLLGGGRLSLGQLLGGGVDLFNYANGTGNAFNNPIAAGIAGINLLNNVRNIGANDILGEGQAILGDLAANGGGSLVSGLTDVEF